MLIRHQRAWGALALTLACLSLVGGQVSSVAWYRMAQPDSLHPVFVEWVAAWDRALGGALTWAPPETIHLLLGKACGPTMAVMTVVAWLMYRRHHRRRQNRVAWLAFLASLAAATIAFTLEFWLQWTERLPEPATTQLATASWWTSVAAVASSTWVGWLWLGSTHRPRAAGWSLALAGPSFILWLALGIGYPLLPVMIGLGIAGRRILDVPDQRYVLSPRKHPVRLVRTAPTPQPLLLTTAVPIAPHRRPRGFVHSAA